MFDARCQAPSSRNPRSSLVQTLVHSTELFAVSSFIGIDARESRIPIHRRSMVSERSRESNAPILFQQIQELHLIFSLPPAQTPFDLAGDNMKLVQSGKANVSLGAFLYNHPSYYPKQSLSFDPLTLAPIVPFDVKLTVHPLPMPKLVPVARLVLEQHLNSFIPQNFKVLQIEPGVTPAHFHLDNLQLVPFGFPPNSKQVPRVVEEYLASIRKPTSLPTSALPLSSKEDF